MNEQQGRFSTSMWIKEHIDFDGYFVKSLAEAAEAWNRRNV